VISFLIHSVSQRQGGRLGFLRNSGIYFHEFILTRLWRRSVEGEASLQDGKEIRLAPCRMRVTVELEVQALK